MISISCEEYSRLLKSNVQLIKYKELCQTKSSEIKRLQDQVGYFKKLVHMLRHKGKGDNDPDQKKQLKLANVMPVN